MLKRFKKKDNWKLIGDVQGYMNAIDKLGLDWQRLDQSNESYADSSSVWGQLANFTNMKNNYEVRKWFYTVWREDRRQLHTRYVAEKSPLLSLQNAAQQSQNSPVSGADSGKVS